MQFLSQKQVVRYWLLLTMGLSWLSAASAQTTTLHDELDRIVVALRYVQNDYVTPISESVLANACREGAENALRTATPEAVSDGHDAGVDNSTLRDLIQWIQGAMNRAPAGVTARQLTDACLRTVFSKLDARSAYFPQSDLQRLSNQQQKPSTSTLPAASNQTTNAADPSRNPASVRAWLFARKHLYLQIARLNQDTVNQLGTALRAIDPALFRDLSGMVLDLRNNPGGVLTAAVGVASAFLPPAAPIATTASRTGNTVYVANSRSYGFYGAIHDDPLRDLPAGVKTLPMAVLVNHQTGAGAELIAAALQDNQRAQIAGEGTLGQGSVQTLSPTPIGVLKLTTSKLLRPSGQEWDIKGVVPDRRTNQKTGPGVEFGSKDDVELVETLRIFDLR